MKIGSKGSRPHQAAEERIQIIQADTLRREQAAEAKLAEAESRAAKHEAEARAAPLGQAIRGSAFDGVPTFDLHMLIAREIRTALAAGKETP